LLTITQATALLDQAKGLRLEAVGLVAPTIGLPPGGALGPTSAEATLGSASTAGVPLEEVADLPRHAGVKMLAEV
jgi:hypothetical protein